MTPTFQNVQLLDVIDRARGWVTNGGPVAYDMAEAEHELEKALGMVRERLHTDANQSVRATMLESARAGDDNARDWLRQHPEEAS